MSTAFDDMHVVIVILCVQLCNNNVITNTFTYNRWTRVRVRVRVRARVRVRVRVWAKGKC